MKISEPLQHRIERNISYSTPSNFFYALYYLWKIRHEGLFIVDRAIRGPETIHAASQITNAYYYDDPAPIAGNHYQLLIQHDNIFRQVLQPPNNLGIYELADPAPFTREDLRQLGNKIGPLIAEARHIGIWDPDPTIIELEGLCTAFELRTQHNNKNNER
jgi:hypothetical protein